MANKHEVKKYLAHWFQLGKKVVIENGKEILSPQPVLKGDRYSPEPVIAIWKIPRKRSLIYSRQLGKW
jgi:hypothetical protein